MKKYSLLSWFLLAAPALMAQEPLPKVPGDPKSPIEIPPAPKTPIEAPACLEPLPCINYNPGGRFWLGAEVLGWAIQGSELPPLVTSSPPGTPRGQAGVLGTPGAQTIYGDERVNGQLQPGIRITYGAWFDEGQYTGLDGSFFTLFGGTSSFTSPNDAITSRPFFNPLNNSQSSQLVNFPGVIGGNVAAVSDQDFYGLDLNLRNALLCGCDGTRLYGLAGYRNMGLYEGLAITENLTAQNGSMGVPAGTNIVVQDGFRTINQYNGGQLGTALNMFGERWMLEARAMLGIGQTQNVVYINGNTVVTAPGGSPVTTSKGGLLAQNTNIGRYEAQSFSFIPEIRLGGGYRVTDRVYLTLGYTFLYWTGVARPGNQIDYTVNPTQIPPGPLQGPARPMGGVNTSDIWIQGISGGLAILF